MHRFLLPLQRRDAENAEENAEKTTQGLSSLFERAGGPRNFMKNRSNGRMGVRRDEVGKRSGEVEATGAPAARRGRQDVRQAALVPGQKQPWAAGAQKRFR